MKIQGFLKTTLLDYPGKVACTIFTAGCNLRCPFCHNAFLVMQTDKNEEFSKIEILEFLKKRKGILDGVCISGGEPLLNDDIFDFIREIKKIGLVVKLDTNGTFPERLKKAVNEKIVDYVAMDIKNTSEKYPQTVGIDAFDISPINESIDFLLLNNVDYEFRTTVVKEFHTIEDIENIAKRISGAKKYFLQAFIDSGNLIGRNLHACSSEEMNRFKEIAQQYVVDVSVRGN